MRSIKSSFARISLFSLVIMILLLHTGMQAQYLTLTLDKDNRIRWANNSILK